MKKLLLCLFMLVAGSVVAFAQIVTASSFFNSVNDVYAGLSTYEADVNVNAAGRKMAGHVLFKRPQMVRIDFTSPQGQVVLFDGNSLVIYLPSQQTILQQTVSASDTNESSRGLTLLRRYYNIAFENSSTPEPLEEGSSITVVRLVLTRRAASEAFTRIRLAVDSESKLIRVAEATTPQGQTYTFEFSNYTLNPKITEQRFIYDPPSSANAYNNFLFQE